MRPPTPPRDPDGLRDVLARLVAGTKERLGANYIGVYLQGSMATGDFDVSSDIDFLVVVEREPHYDVVRRLAELHLALYAHPSHWGQHLEGSYVPRAALVELPPPRRHLLYLDHGSTRFERSDHDHYLAVLWTLRERGIVLDGPDPKGLVSLVSAEALQTETLDSMRRWADLIFTNPAEMTTCWYQAYAVLSYCRMAETLRTGEVHGKRHGAAWARTAMQPRWHTLIDSAEVERRRPLAELFVPADNDILTQTKAFIRHVLEAHV
jgi:predicted nucleotidyltransferase